jgi:hypothetical protein
MDYYDSKRLHELAKNILIGMELVDKRVDTLGGKKVKKELNEEEQLQAVKETNVFFANKRIQDKLERLKGLIVDNTYRNKLNELFGNDTNVTPQSKINEMNMKVTYNPYNEKW